LSGTCKGGFEDSNQLNEKTTNKSRTKFFRDPIHGFIEVRPHERTIIDSPIFQRLRKIHQLSFCYLVYHGAEHSRFGHSLGVMHLASELYDSVMLNTEELGTDSARYDEHDEKTLRMAALLHDVGHPPFSHGLEREPAFASHEDSSTALIEGPLAESIRAGSLDPTEVSDLVQGRSDPKKPYLAKMLNSQLDADRMDYLTRDSHYTGVLYGVFDLDRLITSLAIKNGELVVLEKGILAADQFVISRFYMYEQVYLHRVKRAFEAMAGLFVRSSTSSISYPPSSELNKSTGISRFLECDDEWFLDQLTKANGSDLRSMIARQILDRQPYRQVVDAESIRSLLAKKEKRTLQTDAGLSGIGMLWTTLLDKLKDANVDTEEVLFDSYRNLPLTLRPYSRPLPHEPVVSEEEISPIYIYDSQTDTLDLLENRSVAIKSLSESTPRTARIYASRNKYDVVKGIVEKQLDVFKKEI
jgi:HD superfamily phosphohydrolase